MLLEVDGDCIESVYCLGQHGHFNNIDSFSPTTQSIFTSVCVFSLVHQCLESCLGGLISRHFILFAAMVNVIDSLISLSDISFLVYRNATGFCVLNLYPATFYLPILTTSAKFLWPGEVVR